VTHGTTDHPVTRLKIFHGSYEDAVKAASQDYDQTLITKLIGWRGNPMKKTTLEFHVAFADEDRVWLIHTADLDATQAYEDYVTSIPCLAHLRFPRQEDGLKWISAQRKAELPEYTKGETLYVDIRCYGTAWYDQELTMFPDRYDKVYVVAYTVAGTSRRALFANCDVYQEVWRELSGPSALDPYFCYAYGSVRDFDADSMILVTPDLCRSYPVLISSDVAQQQRVLMHFFPTDFHAKEKKGKKGGVAERGL
jgi:hypothetical protein